MGQLILDIIKIRGVNNRVAMVLIWYVKYYLTKAGIEMGVDEKVTYSITVYNGQINIANNEVTINAVNTNDFDNKEFMRLLELIKAWQKNCLLKIKKTLNASQKLLKRTTNLVNSGKAF